MIFDLVIARGLITSAHNDYKVFKGDVGIVGGKIVEISEAPIPAEYAREYVDANEKILMSGFVNAHCHGDMAAGRGIGGGMTLRHQMKFFGDCGWFYNDMSDIERMNSRIHTYIEAMLSGTTTIVENMFWGLGEKSFDAFREAGIRGIAAEDVRYDFMRSDGFLTDEMLGDLESVSKKTGYGMVFGTLPEEEFTDYRLKEVKRIISSSECYYTSHLAETSWRHKAAMDNFGMSPVKVLDRYGLLSERYFGSHGVYFDEEDMDILAKRGVSIVNTPICELKICDGVANIRKLLDCGVNVALGTDGAMWTNSNDMFREMKTVAITHNIDNGRPDTFSLVEILNMATINGARAVGLEKKIGTVEKGKYADLILIDTSAPHMFPVIETEPESVLSAIVFNATGADVTDVFVSGKATVRNRKVLSCDTIRIQAEVKATAEKLWKAYKKMEERT